MSSSNSRPPTPSTSFIRSALGVTPGWGIGMSNSGSYVSTSTRTSLTIPVPAEESATYDAIKNIVRKKKIREASALRAAKLKQEQSNNNDLRGKERSEKRARDAATAKTMGLRNQLNKLFLQQAELEKSMQYKWKEKVNEFEQCSLRAEQEELSRLRQEQKQLLEKVRMGHENVGDKRLSAPSSETKKGKRKAESHEAEESRKKRYKVAESATGKERGGSDRGGHGDAKATHEKGENDDKELFGDDDSDDGEEKVSESVKKDKELEKLVEEMNDLNKTKSQMIWLLKQVITAEKKLPKKKKKKK